MSKRRRRGSRLFSGSPGLLLVSEDIPGIVMPAPPSALPPLDEDDEPEFDLAALHAEEDEVVAQIQEGPLRVFLGSPAPDAQPAEPAADDDTPIWDVSALAMPEAPQDEDEVGGINFLDEDELVEEEDIVAIDTAPPPLVMAVTVDEVQEMSPPSDWEDSPTMPAQMPPAAVIRDEPPPLSVEVEGDPAELPDRLPFSESSDEETVFLAQDIPTKVDAIMSIVEDDDLGPIEDEWAEDDAETEFFGAPGGDKGPGVERAAPNLSSDPPRSSPAFWPIPEKADPPLVPILMLLVVMVVIAVFSGANCGEESTPAMGTVENPVQARPPTAAPTPKANVGFLTIETDQPAIIYVDNVKKGTTPVRDMALPPGNHQIRALTVETGHRQVVTAHVKAGENRRVVLEFQ